VRECPRLRRRIPKLECAAISILFAALPFIWVLAMSCFSFYLCLRFLFSP
jgi:hypothetical protein